MVLCRMRSPCTTLEHIEQSFDISHTTPNDQCSEQQPRRTRHRPLSCLPHTLLPLVVVPRQLPSRAGCLENTVLMTVDGAEIDVGGNTRRAQQKEAERKLLFVLRAHRVHSADGCVTRSPPHPSLPLPQPLIEHVTLRYVRVRHASSLCIILIQLEPCRQR